MPVLDWAGTAWGRWRKSKEKGEILANGRTDRRLYLQKGPLGPAP